MSKNAKIFKPSPISGFPEWLPEVRLVEQQWRDHIRRVFESYGFCSIETPSVEELDVLTAKGEVDKEIYVIERLHKEEDDDSEARLALHFDQTVPLARYVAQHFNDLTFPFKRYQMQRVWRGERPQAGRFREFTQCDIDVIGVDQLALSFDADMVLMMWDVLSGLKGMEASNITIRINNRKILAGICEALGVDDWVAVTRIIDKLEKIGEKAVRDLLKDHHLTLDQIGSLIQMAKIKSRDGAEIQNTVNALGLSNDLLSEGLEELVYILDHTRSLPDDTIVADLSIVRGLDYYTGTVYETVFKDDSAYGSICSGGRYDDLAGSYINRHLPGVGISLGFSRLFDYLRARGALPVGPSSPADILMVVPSAEQAMLARETAQTLRKRGLKIDLYHAPQKLKKQLSYAEKKGIPFVWFPPFEDGSPHEVKNMSTGDQTEADPLKWSLPDEKT